LRLIRNNGLAHVIQFEREKPPNGITMIAIDGLGKERGVFDRSKLKRPGAHEDGFSYAF
jgi:hypothetical protein